MSIIAKTPRILSVQSHVVSGYCGNKSATFPLQILGFEVDVINSVQLSNHTQYKVAKGQIFTSNDLAELHAGLKQNKLTQLYDIIISGYVADVSYIESLSKTIQDIRHDREGISSTCFYTVDPVLGDHGVGYYVPDGLNIANAYKRFLLPQADIVTPNVFEASILSDVDIDLHSVNAIEQAIESMSVFHKRYDISIVAITSIEIASDPNNLLCLVSSDPESGHLHKRNHQKERIIMSIKIPKIPLPFTGTGDLFTALFTGWLHKTNFEIKPSLENTVNTIHGILQDTFGWYQQSQGDSVQAYELRLVQNVDRILQPSNKFVCEPLSNFSLSSNKVI